MTRRFSGEPAPRLGRLPETIWAIVLVTAAIGVVVILL